MLKMRLQRTGRRNDPAFRVVVTDSRNGPKAGNHVDILGAYNPKMNTVQIDADKAKEWIAKGVQVSDTVHNILVSEKVIEGKKVNVLPKKSPIIDEEKLKAEEEAKAAKDAEAKAPADEEVPAEAETPVEESTDETPAKESKEEEITDQDTKEKATTPETEKKEEVDTPTEEKKEDDSAEEEKSGEEAK